MSGDLLQRRAKILAEYPNTRRLIDRVIELENLTSSAGGSRVEPEIPSSQPCHYPEHRHPIYGYVTHMRMVSQVDDNGFYLECCEVCGTVRGAQSIPIG